MDAFTQISRNLDLSQLLLVHTGLALVSALGTAPTYNLPVALFGLLVLRGEFDGVQMKRLAVILAATGVLDVLWILAKGSLNFTLLFVLANLLVKPLSVACAVQSLQNSGAGIPGLSFRSDAYEAMGGEDEDHPDAAVISMPGALNSP
ncbi:hypothetical protein DL89DRAFT_290150 [Linderina pennispora]|uniref:Uncharacterized protein n=1 Tax=Linderina pennispora TaxID=61395 RepID=A0A1Y1WM41_9FUNG|nr:uncharacterized protein DL89DRAFT_290150 [Linderina pennispora]KAJ1944499.1 hypothetical protein EC988_005973 [Linderina pennispora]ORX74641.1 hypothetical protein DL89DRAFT_290150 [Linderina pennispora]